MQCPICKKPVKLTDPEAPFCSERCREIDLGNWATGKYVISTPAHPTLAKPTSVKPWPDDDPDED